MVSEGVDVPRLRVGVYATTARTELFFRQVIGRFIRRTPVPKAADERTSSCPSDPRLKQLATQIEEERNHALVLEPAGEPVGRARRARRGGEPFRALWSSARRDDDVLQTTQPGDALQLFAEPAPLSPALAAFTTTPAAAGAALEPETAFERRERLRAERHALVGTIARRTGEAHRTINARINREVGRLVDESTDEQLERANRLLEREVSAPPAGSLAAWTSSRTGPRDGRGAVHGRGRRRTRSRSRRRVRRGPRSVVLALALRRESLARLREDPRCALTVLAAGDLAFTALGRATDRGRGRAASRACADRRRAHPGPRPGHVRDRRRRAAGAGPTLTPSAPTPRSATRSRAVKSAPRSSTSARRCSARSGRGACGRTGSA